ncbi:hypothetical protein F5Y08DRAFT_345860 [Xylaria arbuscula]|uniref:Uncharacterized protein n=1 Tax=Xylaria arbuscula TaxID=114810 RepID=A0A9W8NBN5_9PEZI|nr:hypothetical protein F5Y08DRAFT_345860 [Xylaria arbuscula]KAJ3567539.1 hypothetical protein NPX13_g6730 [Xylaria arbuscula]
MSTSILTSSTTLPAELILDNIMSIPEPSLNFYQARDLVTPRNSQNIGDDVLQALEIARDDPEAACHGLVRNLLESALEGIWSRVLANKSSYVMSRDEFAIFNFYQTRFRDDPIAIAARGRYWDNLTVSPSSATG